LFDLKLTHFDFSNIYAPELWLKHTGKKVKRGFNGLMLHFRQVPGSHRFG
jgi:hypothetical protein